MNKNFLMPLLAGAVLTITGCASSGDNAAAVAEPAATKPVFTENEKASMTSEEKVAVYNADKSDDDRIVCRKRARSGSHRKVRVCRTVGEMKADEEAARDALRGGAHGRAVDPGN